MGNRTGAIIVGVAGLVLAACNGGSTEEANTSATAGTTTTTEPPVETIATSTTPSTTTTTTIDPYVAAGNEYLRLVNQLNCAMAITQNAETEVYGADERVRARDWPTIRDSLLPAYAAMAQEELAFMNGLLGFAWQEDLQPDVDKLVAEVAADAGWFDGLSKVTSFEAFAAYPMMPDSTAATVLRAKLGLESNVGSTTDFCSELAVSEG